MENEIKQEFDTIKNKLNDLDTKLDNNTKDGNRITFAVVGFSIAMIGVGAWLQTGIWSSVGNFLIVYGTAIMVAMMFIHKQGFKKWMKIVIKILTGVLIALVLAILIIIFVSRG